MIGASPNKFPIRTNHRIRIPEVRVIGADGVQMGVMPTQDALKVAQDAGLDLVEISPKATPPVCKIIDFGKYKYEEKKRQAQARKNQTVVELKEIKLRPKTDDHDIDFKAKHAREFLREGHKVKFTVRFRGREITHPEKAREQLDLILKWKIDVHGDKKAFETIEDIAIVETRPLMEARIMQMIVAPKKSG